MNPLRSALTYLAPALAFAAILGAPAAPCLALGFAAGLAATLNP